MQRVLEGTKSSSVGLKTLIIDDSLIHALSSSIQGAQLKACGYEKWFRLTNHTDVTLLQDNSHASDLCVWSVVICVSGQATRTSLNDVVKCVIRLNSLSKLPLEVKFCFIPRRSCSQISYLLLSIRHGLNLVNVAWQEGESGVTLGKLSLMAEDVEVHSTCMGITTYTNHCDGLYKDLLTHGNTYSIVTTFNGVKKLLVPTRFAHVLLLIGLGPDGRSVAKKIADHLYTETRIDRAAVGEKLNTLDRVHGNQAVNYKGFDWTGLHKIAESTLGRAFKRDQVKSDSELDHSLVLSDGLLNRCVIELAGNLSGDVFFALDRIRESGLTKRSQQPSFQIRLPHIASDRVGANDTDVSEMTRSNREGTKPPDQLKSIIVIDRAVDWISPLLTPFTYEALLDLQWGIEDMSNLRLPTPSNSNSMVRLTGPLHLRLRDSLVSDIGPALHAEALKIQARMPADCQKMYGQSSVGSMQEVLTQMRNQERDQKDLSVHVDLVSKLVRGIWKNPAFYTILKIEDDILNSPSTPLEAISEILVQLAWRDTPLFDVLRLLMLTILIRDPPAQQNRVADVRSLMSTVQSVLHALCCIHGVKVYETWHRLEEMVFRKSAKSTQDSSSSAFAPASAQSAARPPSDFSFVHSGYTPKSVEILEAVIKQQSHPMCQGDNIWRHKMKCQESNSKDGDILLVFPHHVTYSEIAALRCLSSSIGRKFHILASDIISYRKLITPERTPYTELLEKIIL